MQFSAKINKENKAINWIYDQYIVSESQHILNGITQITNENSEAKLIGDKLPVLLKCETILLVILL